MISLSAYDELVKENQKLVKENQKSVKGKIKLVKKNKKLIKENTKLLKENDKLKSEIEKLKEDINNSLSSSFFMKNDSTSSSLTQRIFNDHDSYIYFPEDNIIEIKEIISNFAEDGSHFLCRKCHKIPIIEFTDCLDIFNLSCSCGRNQNISLKNIIKEYIVRENEEIGNVSTESYLKCEKHKENFAYYCKFEEQHLCRACLKEKYFHQAHPLYYIDFYFSDINQKKNNIIKILYNKKKEIDFNINDGDLLLNLFSVISNDFTLYPNYSHFEIIEKALNFLEHFISNEKNNQIIKSLDFQKRLIIKNRKILYENMMNANIIIEIIIPHSNINDITQICELDLVILEKLYLSENLISNVEPLLRAKFKKIKYLNFARNKIGDENIPYLLGMEFGHLKELNLFSNSLTDCSIFNLQNSKNLPNLEIFYIGNNRINWINSIDIKYNFKNLTEFGLTGGIFDDNSIEYINNFEFNNLKIIYLSRCDIRSLNFVEKLELPCIEEFYLNDTFVNEFCPLKKYKELKIIEMRNNSIKNIDDLKSFFEVLPKLKQFNIKGNNIDMYLKKNEEIMEFVKNLRDKLDIII